MNMTEDRQMTAQTPTVRKPLPKKAFDSEYMTEWHREVKFLEEKGFRYTFVRVKPEYGIKQYKYKKTPELFEALHEFYQLVRNEKEYSKLEKGMSESTDTQTFTDTKASVETVLKEFIDARSN